MLTLPNVDKMVNELLEENREYVKHMYTMAVKIAKKTTFSKAKAVFGFNNQSNIGFIFYPDLHKCQAAKCFGALQGSFF